MTIKMWSKLKRCFTGGSDWEYSLVEASDTDDELPMMGGDQPKCTECWIPMYGAKTDQDLCHDCGRGRAAAELTRDIALMYINQILLTGVAKGARYPYTYIEDDHAVVVDVVHPRFRKCSPMINEMVAWYIRDSIGLPTIFIRYNPGSYIPASLGLGEDMIRREKTLMTCIKWARSRKTFASGIEVIELFFDGWDGKAYIASAPYPSEKIG